MAAFRDMWTRAAGLWGMIAGSSVAAPPWRRGGLVPGRRDPKTKSVSSSRHEGLDLAKVAAMCMVVTLHVFSHGGVIGGSEALTGAHWYACNFIKYLCFGAVNCFVLISSYFLSKAHLRAKRAVSFVLQVLFYLTPVFYPINAVPEKYRWLLKLNPMTHFIEETRNIFLYGRMPSWSTIGLLFAIGLVSFYLGFIWFGKTKKGFADVL